MERYYPEMPMEATLVSDIEYRLREVAQTFINYGVYKHNDEIRALMETATLLKKSRELKRAAEELEKLRKQIGVMQLVERGNT